MSLIREFESSGNWLFKYRGQLPVVLFVLALPVIYFTDYSSILSSTSCYIKTIAISLSLLGMSIRAYTIATTPKGTSGRNRDEQVAESLNNTGIYSLMRHPLYFANYLIWIGIVAYTQNIYFVIIITLAFWLYYERIMMAEERYLHTQFGDRFLDWSAQLPAFIPSFKNYKPSNVSFSFRSILRREYASALSTVIGFCYVDFLINYFTKEELTIHYYWKISLICTIVLAILMRTLRRKTTLLDNKNRP